MSDHPVEDSEADIEGMPGRMTVAEVRRPVKIMQQPVLRHEEEEAKVVTFGLLFPVSESVLSHIFYCSTRFGYGHPT